MKKIWTAIGDFFESIFALADSIGNSINYLYIGVIFFLLVIWILQMIKHRRNNEEHASL